MNDSVIILSVLLVPMNLYCAFWLFREALNLTGMTYHEHKTVLSSQRDESIGIGQRWQAMICFFRDYSSDPERSILLMRLYLVALLPSVAAVALMAYADLAEQVSYVLTGDVVLLAVNVALALAGVLYRHLHPMDPETAQKFREKRIREWAVNRLHWQKAVAICVAFAAFFLLVLHLLVGDTVRTSLSLQYQRNHHIATTVQPQLRALLDKNGFETNTDPEATRDYNSYRTDILCTLVGKKGGSTLEFYGYTENHYAEGVFNRFVFSSAPELEFSERDSHETSFSDGSRLFTIEIDSMYYLVASRYDTVVYAYSPAPLDEITEILTDIGYLHDAS